MFIPQYEVPSSTPKSTRLSKAHLLCSAAQFVN